MRIAMTCLLSVWAIGVSFSARADDDVSAIQDLYANWRTAVESSNIPGYVANLDPQVRLLPPGAPAIVGAAKYGEFLKPVFATANYKIDVDRAPEVEVLGDVAVAEYEYTIHLERIDPHVEVGEGALTADSNSARYFDVLRKNADGQWRVWRHSWQAM